MYLVIIAWMYVVLMMSVAEATNASGTVLGAIVTFLLYGVGPAGLLAYLMSTPARKRGIKKRQAEELAAAQASAALNAPSSAASSASSVASSVEPNTSSHAASGPKTVTAAGDGTRIAPVREEP